MGSIQALRSWALASRANEDTDVQISGFLGGVNKSLGRQISSIIDQLQGVVAERTKAYNQLVASINRTIDGKGGIAEKTIQGTFAGMRVMFSIVLMFVKGADAAAMISNIGTLITNALNAQAVDASVGAAIYDYEKMASQLGYMQVNIQPPGAPGQFESSGLTTGAAKFLDMRDALMPRYNKQRDLSNLGAGYQFHAAQGFVGSIRKN